MKQETDHHRSFSSFEELKLAVKIAINYYNQHRIKEKVAGMSPVQYRIHVSQSVN